MNQRHFQTVAVLLASVVALPSVGNAQTTQGDIPPLPNGSSSGSSGDAVKVGGYQTPVGKKTPNGVMTEIHTHTLGGKQAATLYVRNIPVLTFVGSPKAASQETKLGTVGNDSFGQSRTLSESNSAQIATIGTTDLSNQTNLSSQTKSVNDDPVQRASLVSAKINQLIRDGVDASQITVSWKAADSDKATNQNQAKSSSDSQPQTGKYVIKVNDAELVEINEDTKLANSTNSPAQDALQATNRLRRLIGNAQPISQVANLPFSASRPLGIGLPQLPKVDFRPVLASFRGIASFYGDGFDGNKTASGQRYNRYAMTAAHRSLPFGTKVRVTNVRNGRSVIVTINDRGPFIRGRVIDLSVGAARIIGMIGSGIAPVKVEVIGR
jgi:rare lipoprotein A